MFVRLARKSVVTTNGYILCFLKCLLTISFDIMPKMSVTANAPVLKFKMCVNSKIIMSLYCKCTYDIVG